MKRFAFLLLFAAVVTAAQMPASRKSKSDAEKVASALHAGPKFVTQNATVIDYPTSPGGECRVLRAGSNGWTCLPGYAAAAHDEPGCFDHVFLRFIKDSMAGLTPNVEPHIMIIGLDQKMMQTLNQDASNGEPYVNSLPGHSELYLVIPIREWHDADAVPSIGAVRR
jgi:hypothetical protein